MKRALDEFSNKTYDVAIIGAGIYGASVARDAALRGLSVAIVDKGDFGNATSANSHKIIHGGLRYLQHGDVRRMRESIRERSTLMRIAPHLVIPMPFLIPTYRRLAQGKTIMGLALKLNDLIGFDRNRYLQSDKKIPSGHLISKTECLRLCPGLNSSGLTGGAIFYDGQVNNPDRLTLAVLASADFAGAHLANYVRVTGFVKERKAILGFHAEDVLSSKSYVVRARLIINCSGPWFNGLLNVTGNLDCPKKMNLLKAVVLVTRALTDKVAVGIPGQSHYKDQDAILRKGHRYFFITPWRHRSLIGTFQKAYDGDPDELQVTENNIQELLDEINHGLPGAQLKRDDVHFVNAGFLPMAEEEEQVVKRYNIYDHEQEDGLSGLLSVIGVKYTTARDVAEKVVDLVLPKLERKFVPSQTSHTSLYGGNFDGLEDFVRSAVESKPDGISEEGMEHLARTYGSGYLTILDYGKNDSNLLHPVYHTTPVVKAEVIHAVRMEMAEKLSDVIFRRTGLGTAGFPGEECLIACASIMGREMGWTVRRTHEELEETRMVFSRLGINQWIPKSANCVFS